MYRQERHCACLPAGRRNGRKEYKRLPAFLMIQSVFGSRSTLKLYTKFITLCPLFFFVFIVLHSTLVFFLYHDAQDELQ